MKQELRKEDGNLVITMTVPLEVDQYNPYMGDEPIGKKENLIAIIAGDELGLSYRIDRDYKGKEDDISVPFFIYDGEEDEFRKTCHDLGIEVFDYPLCTKCGKVIYATHTWNNGPVCFDCEHKTK